MRRWVEIQIAGVRMHRLIVLWIGALSMALAIVPLLLSTPLPTRAAAGVPACTDHDPTRWHPAAKRSASGAVICTYDHEHGDDPHDGDALFGALPIPAGQEISYPWMTVSSAGPENAVKHEFYKWDVHTSVGCTTANTRLSFDGYRAEVHHDGHAGAAVRFHSFFVQAHACDKADPGWTDGAVSLGGRLDEALLTVDGGDAVLPADTDLAYEGATGDKRVHGSPRTGTWLSHSTWYGGMSDYPDSPDPNGFFVQGSLAMDRNVLGPVDARNVGLFPLDPAHPLLMFPQAEVDRLRLLDSAPVVHILSLVLKGQMPPADSQGFVTWQGFVSRYGEFEASCWPISADCVPVSFHHMKVGSYQYRNDTSTPTVGPHHQDITSPDGQPLVDFPD
jgi:hypothetical protein